MAAAAPLEETFAALTAKLNDAVGTTKLGSEVQLEDIDALLMRERDQVWQRAELARCTMHVPLIPVRLARRGMGVDFAHVRVCMYCPLSACRSRC